MEIDAQDLITALVAQRNALADENATLRAYAAKLERATAPTENKIPQPQE